MSSMPRAAEELLGQSVFIDGANVAFGQMTTDQVQARASELRAAIGWGPTARVAPVARAWAELAQTMQRSGVGRVEGLPAEVIEGLAPKLWVVLP